jgi:thioester reductase-like protein
VPIILKKGPLSNVVDYLDHWVRVQPDKCFSSFLDAAGNPQETHTYNSFDLRSRFLTEYLSIETPLAHGERALLVYSPGLEMFAAFVACARIGAIPVVVPPPNSRESVIRLQNVLQDCGAKVALTDRRTRSSLDSSLVKAHAIGARSQPLGCMAIETDQLRGEATGRSVGRPGEVLFVQYTSGSTGDPKGVVVSHENVIHNCHVTTHYQPVGVSWLPQFHDMGMIGYYLFLIVTGGTTYGFSPFDFLRRPVLWLETLSRYKGTFTSSPNFGFEYCLSDELVPDHQLTGLDLSAVRVFMNGAEPVNPTTYRRFQERFAPYGLQQEAHAVAYGLAENTLAVSFGTGGTSVTVDKHALHDGVVAVVDEAPGHRTVELMSCGRPLEGIQVRIVDPTSRTAVSGGEVGEIWVTGKSKCRGYWNQPELSDQVFNNSVANDPGDERAYLRTGDLGFMRQGEIYVCGRLKDVIILRGRNYYAQDLEAAVELASDRVRAGSVVAFQEADQNGQLVVIAGIRRLDDLPNPRAIVQSLRLFGYDGPVLVLLVRHKAIVRTSSGKLARSRTREEWRSGRIAVLESHLDAGVTEHPREKGLKALYERILQSYSLSGKERRTLSEAGLDSLAIVELLLALERVADEAGAPNLKSALEAPLLQDLPIVDLTEMVERLERDDAGSLPDLARSLVRLNQERQDRDLATMRRDARLAASGAGDLPVSKDRFSNVLLTGGTGSFGPFLLQSLLSQSDASYSVVVRAADEASGRERLREGLRQASLFSQAVRECFEARVSVVCGDIAQANLGLSTEAWSSLAGNVDSIIHSAAAVDYALNYAQLKPANVDGTRELLRLACATVRKQFHLVSSTIIFGWSRKKLLLEADSNGEMAELDFGYAQSKWVSEQLAFEARAQGLDVRVYRPSFLTASTSGFGDRGDVVLRILAFMINHGLAPRTLNQISFLPVDVAAHNVAALMARADFNNATFHVTVDEYYNLVDVTRVMSQDHGIRFRYVELDEFVREMCRLCTQNDPAYPLLDFIARTHLKFMAMQHKRYSNTAYRSALAQTGLGRHDPSLRETVSYLMTCMRNEGLISYPTAGLRPAASRASA